MQVSFLRHLFSTANNIIGDSWDIDTWSSVEVCTGLFCASAPATKPLLRKIAPGLMGSTTDGQSSNGKGYHQTHSLYTHAGARSRTQRTEKSVELQNREILDLGDGSNSRSNTFWVGEGDNLGKEVGNESTETILTRGGSGNTENQPDVMRNLSAHVTDGRDVSGGRDTYSSSLKGFEHV
jgi:hypothetical protein